MIADFKQTVNNGDVIAIRKGLLSIFNTYANNDIGVFEDSLTYAEEKIGAMNLYESYSGKFSRKSNKEEWNDTYITKVFLSLFDEFSREMVYHLKSVARYVYWKDGKRSDPIKPVTENTDGEKNNIQILLVAGVVIIIAILLIILL